MSAKEYLRKEGYSDKMTYTFHNMAQIMDMFSEVYHKEELKKIREKSQLVYPRGDGCYLSGIKPFSAIKLEHLKA